MSDQAVREAFLRQAGWCDDLGSPLTGQICRLCAERLDRATLVGRHILDWPTAADGLNDAVPLRLTGALHALARTGDPIAAFYPPHAPGDAETFWAALSNAFVRNEAHILSYLASAPQTNEVMRSAVLMLGFLEIARHCPMPQRLFELGASAGLNMVADQFQYQWGDVHWGNPQSPLRLTPVFDGRLQPVDAIDIHVLSRQGVDLAPVDISDPAARTRLISYVWADQPERLRRLETALEIAGAADLTIAAGDAAAWTEHALPIGIDEPVVRILYHSITWQYFPETTKQQIMAHMEKAGAAATHRSPLAWLRFEQDGDGTVQPTLRLNIWPGGEDRLLARAHPHGSSIKWLAQ